MYCQIVKIKHANIFHLLYVWIRTYFKEVPNAVTSIPSSKKLLCVAFSRENLTLMIDCPAGSSRERVLSLPWSRSCTGSLRHCRPSLAASASAPGKQRHKLDEDGRDVMDQCMFYDHLCSFYPSFTLDLPCTHFFRSILILNDCITYKM